jgi:hypothetical protein
MAIHHIEMDDGSPAFNRQQYIVGKMGKIGGENRRCQFDQNKKCPESGDVHDFNNR